jgi:hypothetical protein
MACSHQNGAQYQSTVTKEKLTGFVLNIYRKSESASEWHVCFKMVLNCMPFWSRGQSPKSKKMIQVLCPTKKLDQKFLF